MWWPILCMTTGALISLGVVSYHLASSYVETVQESHDLFTAATPNPVSNYVLNAMNGAIMHTVAHQGPFLPWQALCPNLQILQDNWRAIAEEARAVVHDAPTYGEVDASNQRLSNYGGKAWRTYILKYYESYREENCRRCPVTAGLLKSIPEINLAMFSIMEPGKELSPHEGPWKGIARVHLGLSIPVEEDGNYPWIQVGQFMYGWKEGELVMFDDTYTHSAGNPTGSNRIVLFLDIDRPDVPGFFHRFRDFMGRSYIRKVNQQVEAMAVVQGETG